MQKHLCHMKAIRHQMRSTLKWWAAQSPLNSNLRSWRGSGCRGWAKVGQLTLPAKPTPRWICPGESCSCMKLWLGWVLDILWPWGLYGHEGTHTIGCSMAQGAVFPVYDHSFMNNCLVSVPLLPLLFRFLFCSSPPHSGEGTFITQEISREYWSNGN